MTLALGDALAVALMEHRAFSPEDFRGLHPGGRLGARLAKVADLMHAGDEMPLVAPEAPMGEALIEMTAKGFGVVGVVDGAGRLVGIVTDGDLRRHMAGLLERRVGEVMTAPAITVEPGTGVLEALGLMTRRRIRHLPVTQHDEVQGFVSIGDLVKYRIDLVEAEAEQMREYIRTA